MNRIAQLGNEILKVQRQLGLPNADNFNPGLTDEELLTCQLFKEVPPPSELHDLYRWRNGSSKPDVPMGQLWIIPGHYLLSADESDSYNRCLAGQPDWTATWFPIMSSGSADVHLIDKARITRGTVPVFYNDPEFSPGMWQIYDSLEAMLTSILECYQEGAYFVNYEGFLDSDARREAAICKRLNPGSDHWRRTDLYGS